MTNGENVYRRINDVEAVVAANAQGIEGNRQSIRELASAITDLKDIADTLVTSNQEIRTTVNQLTTNYSQLAGLTQQIAVNVNQLTANYSQSGQLTRQIALSQVNLNENIIPQFVTRMEEMQSEIREMQSEIRGLQTENRRIMDRFFGEQNGEQPNE